MLPFRRILSTSLAIIALVLPSFVGLVFADLELLTARDRDCVCSRYLDTIGKWRGRSLDPRGRNRIVLKLGLDESLQVWFLVFALKLFVVSVPRSAKVLRLQLGEFFAQSFGRRLPPLALLTPYVRA